MAQPNASGKPGNNNKPTISVTMKMRKTTRGTIVYEGPAQLPTLYVPRLVWPNAQADADYPQQIEVILKG